MNTDVLLVLLGFIGGACSTAVFGHFMSYMLSKKYLIQYTLVKEVNKDEPD